MGSHVKVTEETGKTRIMQRVFKVCNTLFILSVFLYFIITEYVPASAMESLTYQGLLLLSLYCVSALLEEMWSQLGPVTALIQNVAFPTAVFISSVSWSAQIPVDHGGLATFKNHCFHTFNTLSCLLSMLVYKQVWSPKQCYAPLFYGLGYVAFAATSQSLGGEPVYPFLDFHHRLLLTMVVIATGAIVLPGIHLILCLVNTRCCNTITT